ncbi:MAG: VOC family protein [Deltaproteobacteria bacterium]|nr:VOC family protein [Deltaproteobacteria bacterium]MBW2421082.1 VOC family protein [Deltaproteobacteria bacterium]
MVLTGIDRIVIAVEELDRASRHYAAMLGRSPAWLGEQPAAGTLNALFPLENTTLELLAPAREGVAAEALEAQLGDRGEGLFSICFATGDVESAAKELQQRGLSPSSPAAALSPAAVLDRDLPSGAFRRSLDLQLPEAQTGGIRLRVSQALSAPEEMPPSLVQGDPAGAVNALDHVVIISEQPERARELYGEKLGIRLALDKRFEERGMRLLFFRLGGATLELGARLAQEDAAAQPPAEADLLWGIAYDVPDADAAHGRAGAAGVEVSGVRSGRKPGTRVCTVKSHTHGVATLLIGPDASGS